MRTLPTVAVIGAGAMGGAMAQCLTGAGYSVWVRDVSPDREKRLQAQGLKIAGSPAEAAMQSRVIFIVVVDQEQIEEVLWGQTQAASNVLPGLLANLGSEHTVFFNSTIAPEDVARFCQAVAATGAKAVDAPISGGPGRAAAGTMSMMLPRLP